MRYEKQIVRDFYDSFGWQKNAEGVYKDTESFVDIRPVMKRYYHKTLLREKAFLNPHGRYLLDAGSGPVAHDESVEYSSGYDWRICVDISTKALSEAKSRLKEKCHYVVADITKLPFPDNIFDATTCDHVLYHIPDDEQKYALFELYRTLNVHSSCVVVYTWPFSRIEFISTRLKNIINFTKRMILLIPGARHLSQKAMNPGRQETRDEKPIPPTIPPLYYKPQDYHWFKQTLPDDWEIDIRCWRSLGGVSSRMVVPDNLIGYILLEFIYVCETAFPHIFARIGRYPMIILRK
jgi:ubiquinone/menaquinone biosynthesis C-methylase UbiE